MRTFTPDQLKDDKDGDNQNMIWADRTEGPEDAVSPVASSGTSNNEPATVPPVDLSSAGNRFRQSTEERDLGLSKLREYRETGEIKPTNTSEDLNSDT
ncbi:MAG: hypothetical protein AAB624_03695 [Patescibacteria group bacterium]